MDQFDFSSVIVVSIALLSVSIVLMLSHVRSWREFIRYELNAQDFDYRRRQYRRRMQTSAMLAILAVAIAPGYILTVWLHSVWFAVLFWCAVMLVACWVALLAIVDMWATRHHYGRLHYDCLVEQAKLQAEIRHMQAARGNGKATGDPMGEQKTPKKDAP